jgi:hypothetical protein
MGRTLTNIALVAAAVAVNVIPGVGQVISGALIPTIYGAGVAAGTAVSIGSAIASAITLTITAAGLQAGFSLVGLGPSIPKPDTTQTSIKTSRPPRVSMTGRGRLYGASSLYETASNGTAIDVYAVHDGPAVIEAYYLSDQQVTLTGSVVNPGTDGRYKDGAINLYVSNGASVGTAFAAVISLLPGIWTSAHRGDGIVMMALTAKSVKAKAFQETYPSSSVPPPSIVAQWNLYPDPAAVDPSNESQWTWTENSVRHLLWYKLKFEGVDYATKIAPTIDGWIAAAADCDAAMALKAGGTEPRYRSCLPFKHTDAHKDVTNALLATFDGWISPRSDGALVVYSGRYYEPSVAIGPEHIVSYAWEGAGVDDDKAVNEIICSYVSAEHDYNVVECDAWRDEDDITARGQILSQPLDAAVPSHAQARRLAKRKMARTMAPARGTVTTNVAGRIVRGHRYITLHIEEAGAVFYSGPAEITALTRNMTTGGVTFSWVAADPNIDNWNPLAEEGDPAANGDRATVEALAAPVINTATAIDGPRIEIAGTGPDRDDLTWYARVRASGASVWGTDLEYSDTTPGASVTIVTDIVQTGDVEVAIAYAVGDGRLSPFSNIAEVSVDGIIYDGGDADGSL